MNRIYPRGEASHAWRGGVTVRQGYPSRFAPHHPRAGAFRYVPEHILVAEHALGHALPVRAEVHHLNGDRSDYARTNLVICESHAYHRLLHVRTEAFRATGDPRARRCARCKQWVLSTDPELRITQITAKTPLGWAYHRACGAEQARKMYWQKNGART